MIDPVASLNAYWSSLAGGGVPERALLVPAAIPRLLPYLLLSEFEMDPFRVRYRLTGTLVDQWNGISIVGRYLDEIVEPGTEDAIAKLLVCYRRCYTEAVPVIDDYDWHTPHRGTLKVRFGLFPLLVDGAVKQCIAAEDYSALPRLSAF